MEITAAISLGFKAYLAARAYLLVTRIRRTLAWLLPRP